MKVYTSLSSTGALLEHSRWTLHDLEGRDPSDPKEREMMNVSRKLVVRACGCEGPQMRRSECFQVTEGKCGLSVMREKAGEARGSFRSWKSSEDSILRTL